ncbi:translation initiation factor IF-2 subunit gamma [Candidatus Bathyarchaeota archaeon]|nr:translation initiation factor IF-2 subunit gamma [Candidatus Bathyarchaeota archaeon]
MPLEPSGATFKENAILAVPSCTIFTRQSEPILGKKKKSTSSSSSSSKGKETAASKRPEPVDKSKITLKEAEKVQAEINLGLVGHVDHGKTTLTEALSGQWTDRYSEEIERGISIKLGYADAIIAKCTECPEPDCYWTKEMIKQEYQQLGKKKVKYQECPTCGGKIEFLRKVAFVDAPGHEILMATMLSGASLMDGACLLIAADETVPQPQTKEHLAALEIMNIENIVIVQNKIDAVEKEKSVKNFQQIKSYVKNTIVENAPVIPVSAIFRVNLHELLMHIEKNIPTPDRDLDSPTRFFIARSFDINKPGTKIKDLKGGVIGGTLGGGYLAVGDEIEIKPGILVDGKYIELTTTVESISVGNTLVDSAGPGGLLGIKTKLDPSLTKSDGLIGNLLGRKGDLPDSADTIFIKANLMDFVLGTEEKIKVDPLRHGENLMLSIGTTTTLGSIEDLSKKKTEISLKRRICADPGMSLAISRLINKRWRLVGYGTLLSTE